MLGQWVFSPMAVEKIPYDKRARILEIWNSRLKGEAFLSAVYNMYVDKVLIFSYPMIKVILDISKALKVNVFPTLIHSKYLFGDKGENEMYLYIHGEGFVAISLHDAPENIVEGCCYLKRTIKKTFLLWSRK